MKKEREKSHEEHRAEIEAYVFEGARAYGPDPMSTSSIAIASAIVEVAAELRTIRFALAKLADLAAVALKVAPPAPPKRRPPTAKKGGRR